MPIIPDVFPGYNDRGVRPDDAHYAVPRRWAPDQAEGTLLREMIDRLVRPLVDPRVPMMFVTSWNEWNEDTAIEPLAPAEPTVADGPIPGRFADGYAYGGGDSQLRALRDEVVAIGGVVRSRAVPSPASEWRHATLPGRSSPPTPRIPPAGMRCARWLLPADTAVRLLATGAVIRPATVVGDRTVTIDLEVA